MQIGVIYFIIIIVSSSLGAISGMSGGVIMKPIFDAIHFHSVSAISFYSSTAIFAMSIVASVKQIKHGERIEPETAITTSVGSVMGGFLGNVVFEYLIAIFSDDDMVNLIQIILTIIALTFVLIVMREKTKTYHMRKIYWYCLAGLFLGFLSSLLGVGGGPINVALLTLMFSIPIKQATTYSIVIIFFSHFSRLISVPFTTGFGIFDLSILYWIVPAGFLGGFLGSKLKHVFSDETILKTFRIIVIGVICLNAVNAITIMFL